MADEPKPAEQPEAPRDPGPTRKSLPVPVGDLLAGADGLLNGEARFGVSVRIRSSGPPAALVIPDAGGVSKGTAPVYISKPVILEGQRLKTYFGKKGIEVPPAVNRLLETTTASCNAFYFTTKPGPLLMSFSLDFNDGLIGALTGDNDLGELFDVMGASVRVFRASDQDSLKVLQKYVAELTDVEESPQPPVKALAQSTPQLPAEPAAPEARS